ncbi:MAG: alanine--tRNA ligase [Desulfurococcales archaeon]|nr:alanine--tRNA ligase [Desulfurococcales archaeon]
MAQADSREYALEFFREEGFERRRCRVGGEYFWTLNPDFDTCQDAPCVEYWFDRIRSRGPMSVGDARRAFIGFFQRHGHEPVEPRPVVARWREDLYLTIASIVVFQPHVTSGLVPPPANPLVISQPSVRLEDIDNVGLTIGRHLTSFEMAAHHAFNYPDKRVYWKEETARYAFEFFTREVGIPPEMIVFKESWWEGGGNAGPSFEVAVGGLELATLVFMQYKVADGRYEPIPLRIVDTGYGVERIAWFTQKTPTAFHAIYGDLLGRFRSLLGVEEPPEDLMWAAFRAAGRLDPEDPESLQAYYTRVARASGMDVEEARAVLEREARLYSVLDHTKTIALMLADGVVPSNTGEGYLARLVIRRALRQMRLLGADVDLASLVDLQIGFWAGDFPRMREERSYILDAVSLEERRFRETLEKGARLLAQLLKRKRTLTLDDLITLYDSHGVPPEVVAEEAARRGVKVEVPHNFYSIVAARHKAPERVRAIGERPELPDHVARAVAGLPETRRLFHEDPYMRRFRARVVAVVDGRYLVLDATAFYPKGGGQDYDIGVVRGPWGEARVVETHKVGGVIVHVLDRPVEASRGDQVEGEIDWVRRYRLMRHHTATHIVLGAARRVLGNHVWQAGAEKTVEKARLDITHHRPLTREEIRRIEELANRVVDERRRVRAVVMDRNEAERRYGFRIYQGGVPMEPKIRILEVEDWDVEACFGTHLANTGEAGAIKIVRAERIQDGVVRLEYVAATRVAEEAARLEGILSEAARLAGGDPESLPRRLSGLLEEERRLRESLRRYRSLLLDALDARAATAREVDGLKTLAFEMPEPDRKAAQEVLRRLTSRHPELVAAALIDSGDGLQVEIAAGSTAAGRVDLGAVARELAARLGGRGGGRGPRASLRLPREARSRLEEELAAVLGEALKGS